MRTSILYIKIRMHANVRYECTYTGNAYLYENIVLIFMHGYTSILTVRHSMHTNSDLYMYLSCNRMQYYSIYRKPTMTMTMTDAYLCIQIHAHSYLYTYCASTHVFCIDVCNYTYASVRILTVCIRSHIYLCAHVRTSTTCLIGRIMHWLPFAYLEYA